VVPSAGLGANLAILEGIHLCNLLVDMPSTDQKDITRVFETYYHQRAKIAKLALGNSRQFGKVMGDRVSFFKFLSFFFFCALFGCYFCYLIERGRWIDLLLPLGDSER
jgi:2-polyprenyl-6-methoxyphenol hydroxylase-like FAD-dependent oxidoreductase